MYEAQVNDNILETIMKEKEWEEEHTYVTNVSLLLSHISSSIATLGPYYYEAINLNELKLTKWFACTAQT